MLRGVECDSPVNPLRCAQLGSAKLPKPAARVRIGSCRNEFHEIQNHPSEMVLRGRDSVPAAALSGSLFLKPPALPEDIQFQIRGIERHDAAAFCSRRERVPPALGEDDELIPRAKLSGKSGGRPISSCIEDFQWMYFAWFPAARQPKVLNHPDSRAGNITQSRNVAMPIGGHLDHASYSASRAIKPTIFGPHACSLRACASSGSSLAYCAAAAGIRSPGSRDGFNRVR